MWQNIYDTTGRGRLLWLIFTVNPKQPRVTWQEGPSGEELSQLDWSVTMSVGLFWLMSDVGGPIPLLVAPFPRQDGPELYKKASWASVREWSNKHLPTCFLHLPLWVPALASLTNGLWPGSVSWRKPLSFQVTFGCSVPHNNREENRTQNRWIKTMTPGWYCHSSRQLAEGKMLRTWGVQCQLL